MVTELYTWKQETPPDFVRFEFTVVVNLGLVHVCRHDTVDGRLIAHYGLYCFKALELKLSPVSLFHHRYVLRSSTMYTPSWLGLVE